MCKIDTILRPKIYSLLTAASTDVSVTRSVKKLPFTFLSDLPVAEQRKQKRQNQNSGLQMHCHIGAILVLLPLQRLPFPLTCGPNLLSI